MWGATSQGCIGMILWSFQSTHPCGVRLVNHDIPNMLIKFQSTHPCGVRHRHHHAIANRTTFQSTHPCGVRPVSATQIATADSFNPRTRVGCDAEEPDITNRAGVSIHAPVWGATTKTQTFTLAELFQSTHPCGVRHC